MKKILAYTLLVALTNCSEEENTDRDYPRLLTVGVTNITSDGGVFHGDIFSSSVAIVDHGFLWSEDAALKLGESEKISLGPKTGAGRFEVMVDRNLQEGKTYRMAAYAVSENYTVYGARFTFTSLGCKKRPVIFDFNPKQGTSGDIITITGNNFSVINKSNSAYIGELVGKITEASENQIKVSIPLTNLSGSFSLSVTSSGYTVSAAENLFWSNNVAMPFLAVLGQSNR